MILLDTHAWVWWVNGSRDLSDEARRLIESAQAAGAVFISSISAWEVALLVERGRLQLTLDCAEWIARTAALTFVRFVPLNNEIAVRAVRLPGPLHNDPADRMIVATALSLGVPVVTRDRRLHDYPHVQTRW